MRARRPSIHYKWVIAFSGMLSLLAALGLGRFALGMLLPSMGSSLALSYADMGAIGTANFVGYFVAILLTSRAVARFGSRAVVSLALLALGGSMILIGWADSFGMVLALYCLTGAASGFANVPMVILVTPWFPPAQRGRAAGIMSIGSGLGIMLSGVLIPSINERLGPEGWRTSWLVFGVIGIVIAGVCLSLLRERPPGTDAEPAGSLAKTPEATSPPAKAAPGPRWIVPHLGAAYFMFGFTYSIYVTFIVTTLVEERDYSEAVAGTFWIWVGFLSLFSGPLFGALSDRLGRRAGLSLVFAFQGVAYALVAASPAPFALYLSIGLFGICAWSIPSIMAATVGDYMGKQRAVAVFSAVTLFFAIGQISGPYLAGILAEQSGGFAGSYWMAAAMAGVAVLISLALRRPHPQRG